MAYFDPTASGQQWRVLSWVAQREQDDLRVEKMTEKHNQVMNLTIHVIPKWAPDEVRKATDAARFLAFLICVLDLMKHD